MTWTSKTPTSTARILLAIPRPPYKGKTYCFGNEEAKTEFMKDPDANLAKAEAYYSKHSG